MGDKFDEVAGHLVRVGARQFSALALIEQAIKPFLPAGADERLRAAVAADARESFVRLQQRVETLEAELRGEGRSLDDLGAKRTVAIAQEIATGVAEAYGEPKIDAVLNAGARQFDPRLGSHESRRFWLDRVMKLTDLQVRVLMLLKERGPLFYFDQAGVLLWGASKENADLPIEDCVALGSALLDMRGMSDLVTSDSEISAEIESFSTMSYVLSVQGQTIVRFIEPIAVR